MEQTTNKRYYTTEEIAKMYGLTVSYLKNLRYLGQGPAYRKVGKLVLYSLPDVDDWFEQNADLVHPKNA
jgi:hypothetical protein